MKRLWKMRMRRDSMLLCSIVLSAVVLGGCAETRKKAHLEISSPPAYAVQPVQQQPSEDGSFWTDNAALNSMFADAKARGVGDIVTIKIVESSKASNSASTSTGKNTSLTLGIDKFLGLENGYPKTGSTFNPFSRIEGAMKNSFDGKGDTSRKGDLSAYMTAKVIDKMPNGNLVIAGSREVLINNEKQLIILTGTIRERDIAPDNVIQSTYISDAKIIYTGVGDVDDTQRQGWLARFLNVVSPF
ncbi:flagellar basal body L-ring protein FlgH [Desulfatirhabdium butyrativorans]|uniref:flagellar basal body L-ring protein FlgH n=1 Tax=Desulfatirhabdium butyrativorans TaxID=340467 RepID=UPI0004243AD1|nr:flagellar basal body L-ring protein FlgH [Desulfatirhabdium butyrativorans]